MLCRRSWARTTRAPGKARPTSSSRRSAAGGAGVDHARGRAGKADDERLALHEVRHRQPVPDDRRPGLGWTTTAILRAIRHDYPRAADLPGPGFAAGPCLLKDTMQLASFVSDHFPMGQSAMQINEGLPAYMVAAMERRYGNLAGRKIGILGMAFKAESDDTRASLSYKLRKLLGWAGAEVLCTDPYVADDRLLSLEEVIEGSEILVLGVPHRTYRTLNLEGTRGDRRLGSAARGHPSLRLGEPPPPPPPPPPPLLKKKKKTVLVTGAAGFICGYLIFEDLLDARPFGGRRRQLLQVRPRGAPGVRREPELPLRAGRRQGRSRS